MTWLLVIALIGAAGAVVTFAFFGRKDAKALLAAKDLLDAAHELQRATKGELDAETAAHAVTRDELRKEKDLRASAESERNAAYQQEREHVVTIVKASNIADGAAVVAHLLAAPLANGVPPLPAAKRSESGPDALIDPGL